MPTENHKCEECETVFEGKVCLIPVTLSSRNKIEVCPSCADLNGYEECEDCGEFYRHLTDCDGQALCDHCRDAADYIPCDRCREFFFHGDMLNGPNGDGYYCEYCHTRSFNTCYACGEVLTMDDSYSSECDDHYYCEGCLPDTEEWEPLAFDAYDNTYDQIGSRCFGVEIETSICDDFQDLHYNANLRSGGAKHDGSIDGMEFVSAILEGDKGLDEIEKFCNYAKRNHWGVDEDCGLHVHFDMRGEDTETLRAITLAYHLTYSVWSRFVDSSRDGNPFCSEGNMVMSESTAHDDYKQFAWRCARNRWVNFSAYNRHTTFEVRFHESTLDAREICNWIRAHEAFIAWAKNVGFDGVKKALWVKSDTEKFNFVSDLFPDDVPDFYGCSSEV